MVKNTKNTKNKLKSNKSKSNKSKSNKSKNNKCKKNRRYTIKIYKKGGFINPLSITNGVVNGAVGYVQGVGERGSKLFESEEVDECNDKDILEKFYDEENLSDYFYNHNDEIIDEYNKKIDEYNPNKKSYEQIKVGEEIEIPDLDLVELKNTISESIGKKVCINEDKGDESIVYVDRR